jgi:CopA family copper-resistance protein
MFKHYLPCLFLAWALLWTHSTWAQQREYHLYIDQQAVSIGGKTQQKLTVNGQFPAPTLSFEEGDEALIVVHNLLKHQASALHWHGLLLPAVMDGVPGLNGFAGIAPQGVFRYRFKIRQNGSYWYHAHSQSQEQDGLYGALIIYPKGQMPQPTAETKAPDYVLLLSDDHQSSGDQIFKNLKKSSEYYQNQRQTLSDLWQQLGQSGIKATWAERKMWNQMRMLRTDLSDVTGYQFLLNGKTAAQNWTGSFKAGETVRLRFINASAMSFFDVRIPHLKMTVISADGQAVQPVSVDEFRIGTAETYDVLVEPKQAQYQIQAESMDRSGFALGSLLAEGQPAQPQQVPQARPRALLAMEDMPMMAMSEQISHSQSGAAVHAQHPAEPHAASAMASMSQPSTTPATAPAAMLDHSLHQQQTDSTAAHPHAMSHAASHAGHSQQMASAKSMTPTPSSSAAPTQQPLEAQPARVEGWANAATPAGQKALSYADLKALQPQRDLREPTQNLQLRLGGSMQRYIWTINGQKYDQATPLQLHYGERVRLSFVNDSMMAHPMHLHGMFVQLENGQSLADLPNKHTIIVPPNKTVSVLLTADELGEWAIHCHLLYHMSAGMMTKLIVAKTVAPSAAATTAHNAQGVADAHHH